MPRPVSPGRVVDLDRIFTPTAMASAWKDTVREGMRRQVLRDLHDFLDVHRNVEQLTQRLRVDILRSTYRPSEPEVVTIEKKHGILRRLSIPCAPDAIVLQTIVDVLEEQLRKSQPNRNSFYSRSHGVPEIDEFEGTFGYPWWILWPKFQKKVLSFTKESPYMVTTDVANYFDCIPLRQLRDVIASYVSVQQAVLDFLFFLLEAFVWRPEYVPLSGVGLPQLNFDAPRLLGHCYLFKVDEFLAAQTDGETARWMDDINFAVADPATARDLTGRVDRLLSTFGVRLNAGKTTVLSAEDGAQYFWLEENSHVSELADLVDASKKSASGVPHARKRVRLAYRKFKRMRDVGHRDKIVKRYLKLLGDLRDESAIRDCPHMLEKSPGLRDAVFRYFLVLGPKLSTARILTQFLRSGSCVDDASFFAVCSVVTTWTMRRRVRWIYDLVAQIRRIAVDEAATPARVASALWPLCKYYSARGVAKFMYRTEETWTRSNWAARQFAAASPCLPGNARVSLARNVERYGLTDAIRVLSHIDSLGERSELDSQLRAYLLQPPDGVYGYPLPKVILTRHLLRGELSAGGKNLLLRRVLPAIADPWLAHLCGPAG